MCGASSGDCKGDFQRLEYLPCSPASCSSLSFRFWAEFRVAGIARPVRCIDEMQTGVAVAYCLPMHAVLISPGKAGKAGLRRLGRRDALLSIYYRRRSRRKRPLKKTATVVAVFLFHAVAIKPCAVRVPCQAVRPRRAPACRVPARSMSVGQDCRPA